MEKWKDIPGYEGKYQASGLGQIRSVPRKWVKSFRIKKQRLGNWRGSYYVVSLNCGSECVSVHRLVAMAFYGTPPDGRPEVNHIDGNKLNNLAINLEWVSSSENRLHAYRIGLHKKTKEKQKAAVTGLANERCRFTKKQVIDLFTRFHMGENRHKLAKEFGVSRRTIYNIGQGKSLSTVTANVLSK